MRAAMANQALTVHGNILPAGETRMLLQDDKLHPSASGCAALAVAVLDVVQSKEPAPSTAGVRWDPKEVFRQVAK
jgi:lysophospholipase L1-like esterase